MKNKWTTKLFESIDETLTEKKLSIDYEWNRAAGDSDQKTLAKKYKVGIKVVNQMSAIISGEKKNILNFIKGEVDKDNFDADLIEIIYPELI